MAFVVVEAVADQEQVQELKRRTHVARVFPNESSLLRLVSAPLSETSQDWETRKIHLSMPSSIPPTI